MVKEDVVRLRTLELQNRLSATDVLFVIREFVHKMRPELDAQVKPFTDFILATQKWYPFYDYALSIYEKEFGVCKVYSQNKENPNQLGKLIYIF